jgi:hypothetical protein
MRRHLLQRAQGESQPRVCRAERRRDAGGRAHLARHLHAVRFVGYLTTRPVGWSRSIIRSDRNCYPSARNELLPIAQIDPEESGRGDPSTSSGSPRGNEIGATGFEPATPCAQERGLTTSCDVVRNVDCRQVSDPKRLDAGIRIHCEDHIAQRNPEGTPQKSYFRAGNWSMTPCFKARMRFFWPGDRRARRLRHACGGECEDLRDLRMPLQSGAT